MLREDKNARIERVEVITEAETAARDRADAAEQQVSLLNLQISQDEETVRQCEEGLEAAAAQRHVGVPGFIDRLLSGKARQMERYAHGEYWAVVPRLREESRYAQPRLDGNREALAAADAELAAARQELLDAEAARIPAFRLHGKDHVVVFPEDAYEEHEQTQATTPVLITTWETRNWWWFAGRFWWDSEGLEPDDVQALVLQRDKKKQASLERARADAFGSTTTDEQQVARRAPIPESVRHEVWRRDQGMCVDCGSRENLEFDHIIPFSKGGSNTARNLELRCETCNRRKGATI